MSAGLPHRTTHDAVAQAGDAGPVPAGRTTRVLLADLAGSARRAVATLVDGLDGVTLTGQVGDRREIAAVLRRSVTDVLLIDDRLLAGVMHVLSDLGPQRAGLRVIVIGVDDDPAFAARAHRLGAEAWVSKARADEELPALVGGLRVV